MVKFSEKNVRAIVVKREEVGGGREESAALFFFYHQTPVVNVNFQGGN